MIGTTISHYRITDKLGEGGMGVVYKAEDTKLKRPVALKFLAPHLLRDEEGRKRFQREAMAAAALDHPNVCTVYEIDEADGRTFIVMAFLEGQALSRKIADGPLKLPEALSIAIQMADGLEAAHEKNVVHRDIKPDNVMLLTGSRGLVKIMDFGLAQLAGSSKLTREGTTLGTPTYMSPEQALGEPTDRRSDVWGLGATFYEMVAGRPPFQGEVDQAVVYAILNEEPEPLTAVRTGVPKALELVVDKCLAKKAEERYQHTADLLVDLQALRREREPQASQVRPAPTAASRTLHAVLGLGVLLAVAGILWWFAGRSATEALAPQYNLRQLTHDTGLTSQPAISKDGRMIAYASDRAGEGNLDIWVQQVAGGGLIPLTDHEADDWLPDFSPEGSQVVFQSDRDGGGVYVAPALGGAARLLAKDGWRPQVSPDGQWVAYDVGGIMREASIHVVAMSGGASRKLETGVAWGAGPVWSPDGQYILFAGSPEKVLLTFETLDWWIAPAEGGQAVKTGVADIKEKAGLRLGGVEASAPDWLADPDRIIFSSRQGDTTNIYQLMLASEPWWAVGTPLRLTQGISQQEPAALPDGRIAFTSRSDNLDVWVVAIDANGGKLNGEPEPVTASAGDERFPTVSADGAKLAFVREQSGSGDIWIRDNETGVETPLVVTPAREARAIISPDGTKVAFVRGRRGNFELFVIPTGGGVEEKLDDGVRTIMPWSPDSRKIIHASRAFDGWSTIDVETREVIHILENQGNRVHSPAFSPDGQWLSFKVIEQPARVEPTFIAPLRDGVAAPRSEWIRITKDQLDGRSWWSPDGNLLYFFSRRDGFRCIWASHLDPGSKRPVGELKHVFGFHEQRRSLRPAAYGLAADKLYLSVQETTGNIWLAEPQTEP